MDWYPVQERKTPNKCLMLQNLVNKIKQTWNIFGLILGHRHYYHHPIELSKISLFHSSSLFQVFSWGAVQKTGTG